MIFKNKELYLAAALEVMGFETTIQVDKIGRADFIFDDPEGIVQEQAEDYFANRLEVSALALKGKVKELNERIRNMRDMRK